MASIVDGTGAQAESPDTSHLSRDVVSRTQGLIIARLRGQGLSFATIARIMNITRQHAHRRYRHVTGRGGDWKISAPQR